MAFGLGYTDVINGVSAADAVSLAHYVGGVALFVAGLFAFRDGDSVNGTAYSALGALWFTWAVTAGSTMSANAAGLFLLLFALVALSLTLAGGDQLTQGTYGLFFVSLVLLAIAQFPAPLKARSQRPQQSKGKSRYSTVTDFARFLGLSMSRPSVRAVW